MSKIFKIRVPQEVITFKDDPHYPEVTKIYNQSMQLGAELLKGVGVFTILPSTTHPDGSYLYDIEVIDTDGREVNTFTVTCSNTPCEDIVIDVVSKINE